MLSSPMYTIFRREVKRWVRVLGQTITAPLINSGLYLLIFGVNIGQYLRMTGDIPYLNFLIPGLVMMAVLKNSFQNASSSIVVSKFHGELEDFKTLPLSSHDIVWGMSMGSLLRGVLVGFLTLFMGELFCFYQNGALLGFDSLFYSLFFTLIAGLCFSQIGVATGFLCRTFDQLSAFGSFILVPLIYLGGVFYPVDNLPPLWQAISRLNPMLYFISGVRYGFLGESDLAPGLCVGVTIFTLLLTTILAYWSVIRGRYQRY